MESAVTEKVLYLLEENELERAGSVLEEIVRSDSATAAAHSLLGRIYFHLGETEKARKALVTALELDPSSLLVRDCLVHLRKQRQRKRLLGILSFSLPPLILIMIAIYALFPHTTGSGPQGEPTATGERSPLIAAASQPGEGEDDRERRAPEPETVTTGAGKGAAPGKAATAVENDAIGVSTAEQEERPAYRSPEGMEGTDRVSGASPTEEGSYTVPVEEWVASYREAVDLNFRGDYRESLSVLRKLKLENGPVDLRDNLLFWRGVNLRRMGRIRESEICLEKLVEEFPRSNKLAEARILLGKMSRKGEL